MNKNFQGSKCVNNVLTSHLAKQPFLQRMEYMKIGRILGRAIFQSTSLSIYKIQGCILYFCPGNTGSRMGKKTSLFLYSMKDQLPEDKRTRTKNNEYKNNTVLTKQH